MIRRKRASAPSSGASSPIDGQRSGQSSPPAPGVVLVLAAHGGCGATTLSRALGRGASEVVHATYSGPRTPCLVVAAGNAHGLGAATDRVAGVRAAGVPTAAVHLAVVGDGRGPLPLAARTRLRALRPLVASVTRLPYVQRWRYEPPEQRTPAPGYDSALAQLTTALAARDHHERSAAGPDPEEGTP